MYDQLESVEHVIVCRKPGDASSIEGLGDTLDYEELLAAERPATRTDRPGFSRWR